MTVFLPINDVMRGSHQIINLHAFAGSKSDQTARDQQLCSRRLSTSSSDLNNTELLNFLVAPIDHFRKPKPSAPITAPRE